MSNARSPRDVCSTTIGTRGLMAATLYPSEAVARRGGCPSRDRRPVARTSDVRGQLVPLQASNPGSERDTHPSLPATASSLGSAAGSPELAGSRAFLTLRRQEFLPRLDLLFASV